MRITLIDRAVEGERLVHLEPIGPRFLDGTVGRVTRRYTELMSDRVSSR